MPSRRKILIVMIALLATIALGVSAYLTWVTWQEGSVAGCTGESLLDCDDVLASRWSKWFGLPVSLLGGLTYIGILGLCWPAAQRPHGLAMSGLFALAMLAAGAAIWFVGLQAIQLQSYCYYCLTVHCCGLTVGVLTLLLFMDRSVERDVGQMRSLLGVAAVDPEEEMIYATNSISGLRLFGTLSLSAVGLAVLMGGQLLSEPTESMAMEEVEFQPLAVEPLDELATTDGRFAVATDLPSDDGEWLEQKNDGSQLPEPFLGEGALNEEPDTIASILSSGFRQITFQALPEAVDVDSMPRLGGADAPHVMLEMMDYTCDHCRKLHPHLRAALELYGDQLAVMIHHVPLSKKCNQYVTNNFPGKKNACDYAQLAIGVWELAPEKFPEFHNWLLESEKAPNVAKARRRALGLVGESILLDKKVKANIKRRLATQSSSFKRLKSGLPVLLFTSGALRGVPTESQQLFNYLESKLGVEPRK